MQTTMTSMTPEFTPRPLKLLLLSTIIIALTSALITPLFHSFSILGPQDLLLLSWRGLYHLFLWQPVTYLFVYPPSFGGIDLWFLLSLAFQMYILWIIGAELIRLLDSNIFLLLYALSGVLSGITTMLLMPPTFTYFALGGPTAAVMTMLTLYMLFYPRQQVMLLFLIPVELRYLIAGIIGAMSLIAISQGNIPLFWFYLISSAIGYFYGSAYLGLAAPFPWLAGLNARIKRRGSGKIVSFNRESAKQEEKNFVEEMLDKISRKGEGALTAEEKRRLKKISKKKF